MISWTESSRNCVGKADRSQPWAGILVRIAE
jgi:hypothetical protein